MAPVLSRASVPVEHAAAPVDAGAHVPPRHLPILDDLDAHGGVTPRPLLPALAPGQRIRKELGTHPCRDPPFRPPGYLRPVQTCKAVCTNALQ